MDDRVRSGVMRIAFVIPYFYPALQYGGQPKSCYELARALVRRGHLVTVLTTDSAGKSRLQLEAGPVSRRNVEGIDVCYYRNLSNYFAFRHRLFLPVALFRDIRRQVVGCDILHIHELRSTVTIAAYNAARTLRLPYVLSPHGGLIHHGKQLAKQVFDSFYGRSILEHACMLAVVSPREKEDARAFNVDASRVRLLPNTVFPEDYVRLPPPGGFRDRWSIGTGRLVLFLGRLHWIKGADLLIQAFTSLLKSHSDVHLAIAGPDDGQERKLRQMVAIDKIQHRVTFTGYLDHETKLQALMDSDVLAIPSRNEIFAITALEALMCGVPVLLSSVCGFAPMPPAECGVRQFQAGNVRELERQLNRMVFEERIKPDIEITRNFVFREFSAAAVAEKAESLYSEAIKASGRR
ncbi:MAG: hypothetical protein DMG12_14625 [Acidobacteria bacterium]|nr:MAG: hypothetical protein DMG12_14625 [Acidobacteriota bacterium]